MEYRIWKPEGNPRAIVQILHGMAEHIARYDQAANALAGNGCLVVGHDHPGHGPKAEKLGYFAKEKGWDALLERAHQISLEMKAAYPGLPLILLGHSMGSFAAREYAIRWGKELDGLVLSGTGYYEKPLCIAGRMLARLSAKEKPAQLVNQVAFAGNNKPFEPARTPFDWLSRDEKEVDKYIADPMCGFVFTGSAFADFFSGLIALTDAKRLSALPAALPIYLFSGDRDPVGQMGEGVKKVAEEYRQAGLSNVEMKLYPQGRHEMFNEINREEVYADLVAWLNGKI